MKLETSFLILIASILLGCAAGLLYYNQGDLFLAHTSRPDESSSSFNFNPGRSNLPEKSLKDEIRQQLSANHTLYEFTAASEQKKTETTAQSESPEQTVPPEISSEADEENMGEVLAKMAQTSPELNDSLNALTEARKASAEQLLQKKTEPEPIPEEKPKALISVNDYSQATPILDVNPIENRVEFQVQTAAEARNSLAQELLAQAPAPAPVQASIPIQTTAPIQNSVPIQTSAPMETPELIQTSALVQTPTLPQSITPLEMLTEPDGLEEAPVYQAVGSLAAPPNSLNAPALENSEDLDQNPLALIMGLNRSEKTEEPEAANEANPNPGDEVNVPKETPAATPADAQAATPAEAQAAAPMEAQAVAPMEAQATVPADAPTAAPMEAQAAVPADAPTAAPMEAQSDSPAVTQAEASAQLEPQEEIQEETAPDAQMNQLADSPFNHHPTRIKKPNRNPTEDPTEKETGAPFQKDEYSLDVYRVNLRKALASFQIETGLKVVASLDVQGTVSCKSKNSDPEVLLASLLADTPFKFVRSGNFVYIAQSNQLENLPNPLEKTETQIFTPEHISLEELELVFRSNLSQFGTCEVTRDSSGQKCLSVTDWVLSLDQLEKVQQIVDVPAPENRVDAFVFQRELDGTFKSLELTEIADSQGIVLQRVSPMETETREDKKAFFSGSKTSNKKEKSSGIQAYTISYRPDSFLVSVRQQLKTQPAPMPGQTSAPLELNQPMRFDFNLNVQDRLVPYQITVTYRQNPQNPEGINAEVVCTPRQDLGPKAKTKDFHFTVAIPSQSRNSLILQLDLGEFPVENSGARKDISYAMSGNRMKKEVIVVLHPFQSVPKIRKNGLSTQAVREIIRQQEVLARKFYGSMNQNEREDSKHCLGIAQRLRLSLGETGDQSFNPGGKQEL